MILEIFLGGKMAAVEKEKLVSKMLSFGSILVLILSRKTATHKYIIDLKVEYMLYYKELNRSRGV